MAWQPAVTLAQDIPDAAHTQYTFDVPAQPLPEALQSYGEITGVAVLIDAGLSGGLRSTAVYGRYARREALQRMLTGTGLAPHFVENGAFTLVPEGSADALDALPDGAPTSTPSLPERTRQRGARVIQQSLEQALCGTLLTRPGRYRASLRFW
ncbi:MAG: STN domain-containing protein, partial [Stenotrophomonas maltophilia]